MRKQLSPEQHQLLIATLKSRFEKNMVRHKGVAWPEVQLKLDAAPHKLCILHNMEETGGEPDVIGRDKKTGEYILAMIYEMQEGYNKI